MAEHPDEMTRLMERMVAAQEAAAKARAEGEVGWAEASQVLHAAEAEKWTRHTMKIVFTFRPENEREMHEWQPNGDDAESQASAEQRAASFLREAAVTDSEFELDVFPTTGGRGADWPAIGMLVVGAGVVGPPIVNSWFDMARNVSSLWKRLRKTRHPPLLSVGALTLLCVEDLRRRTGSDLSGVALVAASDLGQGDMTHSGHDPVVIVFASVERSWLYLLDTSGHVLHFAEFDRLPAALAYGAGLGYVTNTIEYPLLESDDDPS